MNLLTRLQDQVRQNGKKLALITETNRLNYEEFLQFIQILDIELMTRGVRDGQTIVVPTDRAELVLAISFVACLHDITLVFSTPEIAESNGVAYEVVLDVVDRDVKKGCRLLKVESDWFVPMGTLPTPDYSGSKGTGRFMFQTSGSTGRPKLVSMSVADRLWELENYPNYDGPGRHNWRFLSTIGLSTGMATAICQDLLMQGGTVVAVTDDKEHLLQYLDLYRVDTLLIASGMAERILKIPEANQYLGALKRVMFTGAYSGNRLQSEFAAASGATVHFGYGAVEIGAICRATLEPGAPVTPGYIGDFIREDLELAFLDDTGAVLPGANEGLLALRPKVGRFRRQPVPPGAAGEEGGMRDDWWVSGDYVRRDGQRLYFLGRAKNILNQGGNKIALELLEEHLKFAFPNVFLAAVVLTDPEMKECLAVITERTALDLTEVNSVLGRLRPAIRASRSEVVDYLPMTASGKIDRQALTRQFRTRPN